MADTFVCAMCDGEFEKNWSDDEAEVELKENFGENFSKDDCDIVCDDCYNKIKPSNNPEFFANFQTAQQMLAPDAGDSAVSTSLVQASALSTSQAESTPATTQAM